MRLQPALPLGDAAVSRGKATPPADRRIDARGGVLAPSGRRCRSSRARAARTCSPEARACGGHPGGSAVNGVALVAASVSTDVAVLEGRNLTKSFWVKRGRGPLAKKARVHAVEAVSVRLDAGKVTAIVGESGAGKTTVARMLAKIIKPDAGEVYLDGEPAPTGRPKSYAAKVQMVFQDPFASLNPGHRVRHQLVRPLEIHHIADGHVEQAAEELLRRVALQPAAQYL